MRLGDFTFSEPWVQAAIALFVLALPLGGLGGRRRRHAHRRAETLAGEAQTESDETLRRLLEDGLSRAANYASLALVAAIVALMAFQ